MKESSIQGVNRSLIQQLVYLCKQFLVCPLNYHFRMFSTRACSYLFPEPSSRAREGGAEGSKKGSLLPLTGLAPSDEPNAELTCEGGGLTGENDNPGGGGVASVFSSKEITVWTFETKC